MANIIKFGSLCLDGFPVNVGTEYSHSTKQRNLSDKTWVPGEGTGCGERQNKLSSLHFSSKKDPLPHQYRIQAPCISSKQNPISEKIKRKGGIHTDG